MPLHCIHLQFCTTLRANSVNTIAMATQSHPDSYLYVLKGSKHQNFSDFPLFSEVFNLALLFRVFSCKCMNLPCDMQYLMRTVLKAIGPIDAVLAFAIINQLNVGYLEYVFFVVL